MEKSLHTGTLTVKRSTLLCFVVGVTGFEPATPWSQTRCATNCATPRNYGYYKRPKGPFYAKRSPTVKKKRLLCF